MEPSVLSISSSSCNIRQDIFPLDRWTITTKKGIILQSKCTCKASIKNLTNKEKLDNIKELCDICQYNCLLPHLHNMPDMLFNNNLFRLEHFTGVGLEFSALEALKLVEETKDPLKVAVADGWQSARADFPFAKSVVKPFDWTFTTNYQGTLLTGKSQKMTKKNPSNLSIYQKTSICKDIKENSSEKQIDNNLKQVESQSYMTSDSSAQDSSLRFKVEETDERIDVNKLKIREEILFYDDITLYEDELADHGTAQYSVKVRVMPKSLFILARFYLRIDGVLARINDTRIYHELNQSYLLREYTNREARFSSLNLPVSTLVNPNELMNHLPIINSKYEKLTIPKLR